MPRTNPDRLIGSEDALARRIAHERAQRTWSYEGLAKRMTDAGCSLQPSAVYKIERQEPRRRVTVDEFVAFARVFDLELDELLVGPELAANRTTKQLWEQWREATAEGIRVRTEAAEREHEATAALRQHLLDHPAGTKLVRAELQALFIDAPDSHWPEDLFQIIIESPRRG